MTAMMQMKLPFTEFEADAVNDNTPPLNKYEGEWREYHAKHPEVYELVKRFAYEVIARGYEHYSIMSVLQRIRWHTDIETIGNTFKINNNHAPYYARLFHADHPNQDGFFRTRTVLGE